MTKRKRVSRAARPRDSVDDFYDPASSKLQFNSYEDLPDSEDEFHINRDKISFADGPEAKRRKDYKRPDAIELSDEEVLQYDDEASSVDYDQDMDDEEPHEGEERDEIDEWGPSREDYYNADTIETEQDALDEEAEALRIQQKRLRSLKAADFGFDPETWQQSGGKDNQGTEFIEGMIVEELPQLYITDEMSTTEKIQEFRRVYPESGQLAKELVELQKTHEELRIALKNSDGQNAAASLLVKQQYRALSSYLASLAMYFALLTSTAQADKTNTRPLKPEELQNHAVMTSLVQSRQLWTMAKDLKYATPSPTPESNVEVVDDVDVYGNHVRADDELYDKVVSLNDTRTTKHDSAAIAVAASRARREERLRRTEQSLASLSSLSLKPKKDRIHLRNKLTSSNNEDDYDLGDEQIVTARETADKQQRRKSLRFYTSQIAQKSNKRANAGRAAGGDDDIPRRERLRDRQERLIREAEKRGQKSKKGDPDADFGDDNLSDENGKSNLEREAEGDDEKLLEQRVLAKKAAKKRRAEVFEQAKAQGGTVVRHIDAGIGSDGRRELGYTIEKNKGLTQRRKKEAKNPRVKKRLRFDDKMKKLRSMKQVYKGGEGKGGYRGELTGIKSGLIRSVKL